MTSVNIIDPNLIYDVGIKTSTMQGELDPMTKPDHERTVEATRKLVASLYRLAVPLGAPLDHAILASLDR